MQAKQEEASGSLAVQDLGKISGPTYATAQLLVQQVAYMLSDKIFAYSPETFGLDTAARRWAGQQQKNARGETTTVVPLQTRAGAGTLALGYVFSADFDLSKRHVPQTLVAPTGSLRELRASLDQLALLYGVASPFVAHVAAVDYDGKAGGGGALVSDYVAALQTAEDLGLGLVASTTAAEAQHMALLATAAARVLPMLHVYDGVRTQRETVKVADALGGAQVSQVYEAAAAAAAAAAGQEKLSDAARVLAALAALNRELGTSYAPFEYHGHAEAEAVLVVFGSVESQWAAQTVVRLATQQGLRIGAVSVRLYRPFIEEAFLSVLPPSVRRISVLGLVAGEAAVAEAGVASALYSDVLAAVSFASRWTAAETPAVADIKYAAASTPLTRAFFAEVAQELVGKTPVQGLATTPADEDVQQYTFWDVDDGAAVGAAAAVASVLAAQQPTHSVSWHDLHDNLVLGGIVRSDIRNSGSLGSRDSGLVDTADVTVVADEKIFSAVDVLAGARTGSALLLRLATGGSSVEDVEKRVPAVVRKTMHAKALRVFVLDAAAAAVAGLEVSQALEQAFFKVAKPTRLVSILEEPLAQCFQALELPAAWAEVPEAAGTAATSLTLLAPSSIRATSFAAFDKAETEAAVQVGDWQAAALGLTFKEAYGTRAALRPDLAVKTATVRVAENRRLTPASYDRNVFHIEFDLGTTGLTYEIGEALGVHADNDAAEVQAFLEAYALDGRTLVQVPARASAELLETRTLYQALVQNLDILGRPPKRFYEALAPFATDAAEQAKLTALGGAEGAAEFKKRGETDMLTYADVLLEFSSAQLTAADLVRLVAPLKRREYSIASAQAVTPTAVSLMIVVVEWRDSRGRARFGQASRYLSQLPVGAHVTVSVKPSVMKLPTAASTPLVLAGLGTGLAPFRAFVQYRALQKARGEQVGAILLFLGSRHQREEYLYGEEWEAYVDAGVVTLLGAAFSRDQPEKIYIQDRMRQSMSQLVQSYIRDEGAFYLCGPTWPVPDVTDVLMEAIAVEARETGRKVDPHKEIDRLKEAGRYVLEVY